MSKKGSADDKRVRSQTTTNLNTVAEESLQSRAPGAVQKGSANVQSASVEEQGTSLRSRGSLQGTLDDNVGSSRGGEGAQQAGWSARQKAVRNEARADEDREAAPQQSGYGGLEQKQHAGSQESPTGPSGNRQSGAANNQQRQGNPGEEPSDAGSSHTDNIQQR
ncbi:hypothetical protein [Pseudoduganella umbonata]|uniref:Uncharacterized protein n=1 Tax=Pseudoduganella umbonata TaxID=864828 RepID=A0A4P8HV82_9BURK|nr:hypothetical protein [Pseudoduganella umbonata]MBB3224202.1 hypothetical protein [Pseudoduganella umbonata]QCP13939.1 hypothetical protein FCL38_28650 [Pseudoduganella umbonata]